MMKKARTVRERDRRLKVERSKRRAGSSPKRDAGSNVKPSGLQGTGRWATLTEEDVTMSKTKARDVPDGGG